MYLLSNNLDYKKFDKNIIKNIYININLNKIKKTIYKKQKYN